MARPVRLSGGQLALARTITGVIAADSSTLTDANIDPTLAINCSGLDTIFLGVEIDAGSSPTATIELLFRDPDAADGSRWRRLLLGARLGVVAPTSAPLSETTGALIPAGAMVELCCFGRPCVFPRVTAVANATSTTAMRIVAMPGVTRNRLETSR